jgi:hypothetical protein
MHLEVMDSTCGFTPSSLVQPSLHSSLLPVRDIAILYIAARAPRLINYQPIMHGSSPSRFEFLALPDLVRREIYTLVLDYPDLGPVFRRMEAVFPDVLWPADVDYGIDAPMATVKAPHVPATVETTPGILLCSRQITVEALEALKFKTLTLRKTPPVAIPLGRPMDITEFISEGVLRKAR